MIPHTLPSLPEAFESGPRSTTLAPWHAYPEGLLHTSHEPRWRQHDAPRPFDREQCKGVFRKLIPATKGGYSYFYLGHDPQAFGEAFGAITAEEMRFWVHLLMIEALHKEVALDEEERWGPRVDAIDVDAPIPFAQVEAFFKDRLYGQDRRANYQNYRVVQYAPLTRLLRELYGPLPVAKLLLSTLELPDRGLFFAMMGPVVGLEEELRALLREHLPLDQLGTYQTYTLHSGLTHALMRCPDVEYLNEFVKILAPHKGSWQHKISVPGFPLLFATLEETLRAYKDFSATLDPAQLLTLFARHGHEHLDELMKLVTSRANRAYRVELLEALLPLHDKALTPTMLDLAQEDQTRIAAMQWLTGEGLQATLGLCELVASRGKRRNQAIEVLRLLKQQGHEDEIRLALAQLTSPTAIALVQQEVLDHEERALEVASQETWPAWYAALSARALTLTEEERAFFALDEAPPVFLEAGDEETTLPVPLLEQLLALLHEVHPSKKPRGKRAVEQAFLDARTALEGCREGLEKLSLGAWSWHLLERWWAQGQPEELAWCVWVLGHCGGSVEATLIEPRIQQHKSWFTREQSTTHAANAIICLRLIGSRPSWMMLELLRKHLKNGKLQKQAQRQVDALREEHGWDKAAWQDRIVPDGGLDAHGTRWFDYGPRRFKLVFRGAFDVEFINEEGEHFTRMPAARKSDEVDAVSQARADYKVVKKQLDQLIAEQTQRFELALLQGQRWEVSDWREFILEHPLLQHFARKLLWAEVDAQNEVMKLFIPGEDGSLIDASYEPVTLSEHGHVRLVHPAELSQEALADWVELLTDFEVVQPFAQLTRSARPDEPSSWEQASATLISLNKRFAWDVIALMRKQYGDTFWSEARLKGTYTVGALSHTVERWEVRYIFNPQVWVDGYGEADAARGAGVFLLRRGEAPVLNPEQVPARITAEALHQVEIISQVLSR